MRKALDALTAEHLLVRVQGRGTFVAEAEDQRILFRFFRLTGDDDSRQFPEQLRRLPAVVGRDNAPSARS